MRINSTPILAVALVGLGTACTSPTSIVVEPLRVINWAPVSGAFCVDVGTTVSATFSDDLDPSTLTNEAFLLKSAHGHPAASGRHDKSTFTAKLRPNTPLSFDTLYTAVVASGVRGTQQGRLAVDLDASFTTVARSGCRPGVQCQRPSDCPGTQICSNIGTCIDECVTDKDCYRGHCSTGTCVPLSPPDTGGGDPAVGDPAGGDPLAGDPGSGDATSTGD